MKKSIVSIILTSLFLQAGWDDVESDIKMMEESEAIQKEQQTPSKYKYQAPVSTPKREPAPVTSSYTPTRSYTPQNSVPAYRKTGIGLRYSTGSGSYKWVWDETDYPNATDTTGDYTTSDLALLFDFAKGGMQVTWGTGSFTYDNLNTRDYMYLGWVGKLGHQLHYNKSKPLSVYLLIAMQLYFIDYSNITGSGTYTENSSAEPELRYAIGVGTSFSLSKNMELYVDYTYAISGVSASVKTDYTYSSGYVGTSYNDVYHNDGRISFGIIIF